MKSVKSLEIRVISMKSNDFEISYKILWSVGPLVHIHDPPIIHRDVSSNNIMLTPYLEAKITDPFISPVQLESRYCKGPFQLCASLIMEHGKRRFKKVEIVAKEDKRQITAL